MERTITVGFWIAAIILLLVYLVISFEWMHRTLVSFLGAALIIFITYTLGNWDKSFFIISFDDAMGAIDLNVIFLLMGMMLFVGVMKKTGMFQFLAFKAYAMAKGNVFVLSFVLQVITAIISAFLDNVTTMLLVLPVTIEIAVTLKINPLTLLVPEAFASNVGGTATLIGDPPNILIGSYAGSHLRPVRAEPDPRLLHLPGGLLLLLPLVAQKRLPQGRSEGYTPHHRVFKRAVQNHQ